MLVQSIMLGLFEEENCFCSCDFPLAHIPHVPLLFQALLGIFLGLIHLPSYSELWKYHVIIFMFCSFE